MFSDDLIRSVQVLKRVDVIRRPSAYYLGVDVARMGGDESTFEVFEREGEVFFHRENVMTKHTLTTETVDKILELESRYCFSRIYIEDGVS